MVSKCAPTDGMSRQPRGQWLCNLRLGNDKGRMLLLPAPQLQSGIGNRISPCRDVRFFDTMNKNLCMRAGCCSLRFGTLGATMGRLAAVSMAPVACPDPE